MKKFTFAAIALIAALAASFSSCGNSPKANLKNDIDTVSYTIGMSQTQGLKEYLVNQLGVDTTYMDAFIKGLNEGAKAGDDKKTAAYYAGIQIGQQISNQMIKGLNRELFGEDSTKTVSMKNFLAGFIAGTTGKNQIMTIEQANEIAQAKVQAIKAREAEKQYGDNKAAGEKFLAENAKKEGVKVLPSGVQYKVIKEGSGEIPADSSTVVVNYEGKTIDGKVFDSSYDRKEPVTFPANRVIKGWTEALVHMPVGSIWEVYIPQELAYGERSTGQLKPFSALIFKIELISIKK
ncbi:MAG: FKBP-type peptidyl-prolyl cis-trans isomerase [Prevotella sp.]|jgi:FKBP-type peptidyl-prolyl cis-trans isomerase FklB|nr:FKBP-type peptidyl-prolyl cis-trans isomerase [Prevotella sp.]